MVHLDIRRLVMRAFAVLAVLNVVHVLVAIVAGYRPGGDLRDLLSINIENSVGQWYNELLLIGAAALLAVAAHATRGTNDARYWTGLAVLFVYLAAAEMTAAHDRIGSALSDSFTRAGVVATVVAVLVVAGAALGMPVLRFLGRLTTTERWAIVWAGVTYVLGALVFQEVVVRVLARSRRLPDAQRWVVETIAENLEMVGLIVFMYGIGHVLARMGETVAVGFAIKGAER